jgi:CHAT domain-containing protein
MLAEVVFGSCWQSDSWSRELWASGVGRHPTVTKSVQDASAACGRELYFAVHGLISERQPQYSGLVLTLDDDPKEDGLLQVYEIFNLKLNADLVVLSACKTGLGKEVKGEGLIGLTRAFMYAGARSLVVSLWQVADPSTAELMVKFYGQLDGTSDKAEALRQAKLKVIQANRYAHPFYWAPFILVGEPK